MAVPAIHQDWRDVTLAHWRFPVDVIRCLLPVELRPDVVDGSAWVSLTPFRIERFRLGSAPPAPFGSSFPETNVRTYVRGPDNRDGLWFLSLDVPSKMNVLGGRALGLPYFSADMSVRHYDSRVLYRSERHRASSAGHELAVEPGEPLAQADRELAELLAGRWRAYTRVAGRLLDIPDQHEPWPLRHAALLQDTQTLLSTAGLPRPSAEPLVHFADGVNARLGPPRLAKQFRR